MASQHGPGVTFRLEKCESGSSIHCSVDCDTTQILLLFSKDSLPQPVTEHTRLSIAVSQLHSTLKTQRQARRLALQTWNIIVLNQVLSLLIFYVLCLI